MTSLDRSETNNARFFSPSKSCTHRRLIAGFVVDVIPKMTRGRFVFERLPMNYGNERRARTDLIARKTIHVRRNEYEKRKKQKPLACHLGVKMYIHTNTSVYVYYITPWVTFSRVFRLTL